MNHTKSTLKRILSVTGWLAACLVFVGSLHAQPSTGFLDSAPGRENGEIVSGNKRWVLANPLPAAAVAPVALDSSFGNIKKFVDLKLTVNRNSKVPSQPLITLYAMHKTPPLPGEKKNWVDVPLTADRLFPRNANLVVWKDGKRLWNDMDPGYNARQSSGEITKLVPGTGVISSSPAVYFFTTGDDDGEAILLPSENTTSPLGQPGTYIFVVELINPANSKERISSNSVTLQLP